MHVNAKRTAFLGLLLAVCTVLLILGGTIQTSTLFFIGAASFCVGVAVREYGIAMGACFFIASGILGFLFMPDKMHLLTFVFMSLYLLLSEIAWLILIKRGANQQPVEHKIKIFWIIRYLIFNLIYLPVVIFAPQLLISHQITGSYLILMIVAGQAVLFVFEKAYCYFQVNIWSKLRNNFYKDV